MVAVKDGDRLVASKKPIDIGMMYGDKVEVLSGIQAGDNIITEGYQGLYDEQPITTQTVSRRYLITIRIVFMSTLENIKREDSKNLNPPAGPSIIKRPFTC